MTHSLATFKIYDTVICHDGARLSVQANRTFWCVPRNDVGPYTAVEVMVPHGSPKPPASWAKYREPSPPTIRIYAKLPVALVHEYLDAHGGMVAGDLPPGCERQAVA